MGENKTSMDKQRKKGTKEKNNDRKIIRNKALDSQLEKWKKKEYNLYNRLHGADKSTILYFSKEKREN